MRSYIRVELVYHCRLLIRIQKAGLERVTRERNELFPRESNRIPDREIVLIHVSAEISRIVRIDRNEEAALEQSANRIMRKIIDHTQPEIGKGAHGERYSCR